MGIKRSTIHLEFQGFLETPPAWYGLGPIGIPQYTTQSVSIPPGMEKELQIPEELILGKRVEYFMAFYLENYTTACILARNLVISRDKITIGEIDFLLYDPEKEEYMHLELVYKFYLYDPDVKNGIGRWVGPNRRDSFINKLERLKYHQLPLIYREEVEPVLKSLSIPIKKVRQQVCFKASLFVPLEMMSCSLPIINNDCVIGYWIRMREFTEDLYGEFLFQTPRKQLWTLHPSDGEEWSDFNKISNQLQKLLQKERSPLVWMKKSEKVFLKFFIVWW